MSAKHFMLVILIFISKNSINEIPQFVYVHNPKLCHWNCVQANVCGKIYKFQQVYVRFEQGIEISCICVRKNFQLWEQLAVCTSSNIWTDWNSLRTTSNSPVFSDYKYSKLLH